METLSNLSFSCLILQLSEERLAKELKETKDQLEETRSRLNQRIMVKHMVVLYFHNRKPEALSQLRT